MIKSNFEDTAYYPPKILKKFRRQIALGGWPMRDHSNIDDPSLLEDKFIRHSDRFKLYFINFFEKFLRQISLNGWHARGYKNLDSTSSLSDIFFNSARELNGEENNLTNDKYNDYPTTEKDWEKFKKKFARHSKRFESIIDFILMKTLDSFENMSLCESETVSTRRRIEFEKKARQCLKDNPEDPVIWNTISLKPYASVFIKWLVNSWSDRLPSYSGWNWSQENWESDIKFVMRGYFYARNKQDGSGFDIFKAKTIVEAKEMAAPHIPSEGFDVIRHVLEVSDYDKSKLPEIWKSGDFLPMGVGDYYILEANFDVIHADDDHIIMRANNKNAAIALGYKTAWCTAIVGGKNYFDDYQGDLIIVCDKNGHRHQMSLKKGQYHNIADQKVDILNIIHDYPIVINALLNPTQYGEMMALMDIVSYKAICKNSQKIVTQVIEKFSDSAQHMTVLFQAILNIPDSSLKKDLFSALDKNSDLLDRSLSVIDADLAQRFQDLRNRVERSSLIESLLKSPKR